MRQESAASNPPVTDGTFSLLTGDAVASDEHRGHAGKHDVNDGVTELQTVLHHVKVAEVALGRWHACVRTKEGRVWCWGDNDAKQVGANCGDVCAQPVRLEGLKDIVQLAAGIQYTCAVAKDRTVFCWGTLRVVGRGADASTVASPSKIRDLQNVRTVAAGVGHACAVLNNGTVRCWGGNASGELGVGMRRMPKSARPVPVPGLDHVRQVVAGKATTCALTEEGRLICWGDGYDCDRPRPITTAGVGIDRILGAIDYLCVIGRDHSLRCSMPVLPIVNQSLLGSGSVPCFNYDELSPWTTLASDVAAAATSDGPNVCFVRQDGRVVCWDLESALPYGRALGGGPFPAPLPPMDGVVDARQVSLGKGAACAITREDRVLCWGRGQIGRPADAGAPSTPVEPDWPPDAE